MNVILYMTPIWFHIFYYYTFYVDYVQWINSTGFVLRLRTFLEAKRKLSRELLLCVRCTSISCASFDLRDEEMLELAAGLVSSSS